ncbi:glycoside hydrolase family 16 protein [Xylariaceae sp. AK1471]|nr:glycoside hydrolase family 16 protein [Xylariaceae sp. AK1471]
MAVASVAAEAAPDYSSYGYGIVWQENFNGAAGQSVNTNNWNIIQSSNNANNEWETYTTSNQNHQLSGGATLQIVPQNNNGAWTSARLESKYVFTPSANRRTVVEAKIRFGNNAAGNKQGIWPAFWMLGDSIRRGGQWPQCGEIDILEAINGQVTGYGTVHCDVAPGGICNEYSGIGGSTSFGDNGWHNWRVIIDRTSSAWTSQTITWYRDGNQYMQVSGGRINNLNVWNSLTATPLYIILNVAVGGDWPGAPNANTLGGWGSEMEVAYVAVYQSP